MVDCGVNDFSVSLDACCAEDGDHMAGGVKGSWDKVIENIEKIPELNKKRKQIGIDYITIKKFFDIEYKSSNQRKFVNCFLEYDPKISGKDLIAYGIKGVEIGNEIRRREIEDFQNLLDKYKK